MSARFPAGPRVPLAKARQFAWWRRPITFLVLVAMASPLAISVWLALLNNFVIERAGFDGADIGWWDHEAAVVDNAYNDRDRDDLVGSLVAGFTAMAARCDEVGDAWQHSSERRPGERFSVEDLARFTLHESIHHRGDALAVRG